MQLEIKIDLNSQPTQKQIAAALNEIAGEIAANKLPDDLQYHPQTRLLGGVAVIISIDDGE